MTCKNCAYFDEDNKYCTHPEAQIKIPEHMIDWPCRLRNDDE